MKSVDNIKLTSKSTICEALKIIDSGAMQIAIVVDEHDRLIGTLRSERNLRALATLRGATCGCEYSESFVLLKEIK